ncbi:MAG: S8 family serine peptidase [Verrucomicrobia bacterium]|nr:S8 family serine peptidase [Verrucomicrobiota bacterium]
MNWVHHRLALRALLTLALSASCWLPAGAAESEHLFWDRDQQRVDANVQTWDVAPLLQKIARRTGWQIYLQPDTTQVVRTRFRNLSEGDALRRLLGDLSFVLVPQTNGAANLYVFRTSRDQATQLIRAADTAGKANTKRIEDELIAILKPGEKIEDLAKRLGAKVTGRIDELNAYRLKFTDAESARKARQALLDDPSVASVDYNYNVPRPEYAEAQGGNAPRFSLMPKSPADGKFLTVGLIDSAVQSGLGRFGDFLLDSMSVAGKATPSDAEPTHGTAMAETILNGLAAVSGKDGSTTVRILPVDVYGNNSQSSTFDVAYGIFQAINAGAKIINLSMGSEADSPFLHDVIKAGYDQGVIFFAAAGNEPVTTPFDPAAWPETTAVTAVDRRGNIASYANRGDFVKAAGPGTVAITFGNQTWLIAGTSSSTAYLSGVAAAIAEATKKPLSEVQAAVQKMMAVPKQGQ